MLLPKLSVTKASFCCTNRPSLTSHLFPSFTSLQRVLRESTRLNTRSPHLHLRQFSPGVSILGTSALNHSQVQAVTLSPSHQAFVGIKPLKGEKIFNPFIADGAQALPPWSCGIGILQSSLQLCPPRARCISLLLQSDCISVCLGTSLG